MNRSRIAPSLLAAATVLATLTAVTSVASADTIDRRQAEQARRIEQGQRSGSLTARESADLRAEQARITELERRAKADGVVTRREAQVLDRAQDAASRHIYQEKHDRETARDGGRSRWFGR
jgi:D-alanyl-D-alanine carboxypeptidase